MVVESQGGMNQVDCSAETVAAEWERIEREAGVSGEANQKAAAPVGPAPAAAAGAADLVDRLRGVLSVGFRVGFGWLAPAWEVTEKECARLAEVWAKVGAKYLPPSWLRWLPGTADGGASECVECDALVVTVQIVGPRLKIQPAAPTAKPEKPEEKQEQTENGKKAPAQFAYAADFPEA